MKTREDLKINQDLEEYESSHYQRQEALKQMQDSITISRLSNDRQRSALNKSRTTQKEHPIVDKTKSTLTTAGRINKDKLETEHSIVG